MLKKKGAGKDSHRKNQSAVESEKLPEKKLLKIAGLKSEEDLLMKLWARLKAAVKAGEMTEEEAKAKFKEMTKKVGNEKLNPGVEGVMKRLKIALNLVRLREEAKKMVEFKKDYQMKDKKRKI